MLNTTDTIADVFINCPFDPQYKPLFEATVFCVAECGFRPRCALEIDDSSQVRIEKILKIISECRFGIHDISRTNLDPDTELPRFNMPLELGMFLAAKWFGDGNHREKLCLVVDQEPYRYQKFISDISGQDIRSHNNSPQRLITIVRNWLRDSGQELMVPGGAAIFRRYRKFTQALPALCTTRRLERIEMTYNDYVTVIADWRTTNQLDDEHESIHSPDLR